jgi:hypothetical protein
VLLRCPTCAVAESYGPTRVLGELVVCGRCNTPFAWQEGKAGRGRIAAERSEVSPEPHSLKGVKP